mgnify:CR=1 FL=1
MTAATANPQVIPNAAEAPVSLEQLRDLQLPDAIGLWPPAPGWWLLIWLGLKLYRYRQRNRYRRQALQELARLGQSDLKQQQPQQWLQQLNQLLRRAALAAYPAAQVAPLSGTAWVEFLYSSSRLEGFRQPLGCSLASGPYQPKIAVDAEALQQLAQQWIRQHREGVIDADA